MVFKHCEIDKQQQIYLSVRDVYGSGRFEMIKWFVSQNRRQVSIFKQCLSATFCVVVAFDVLVRQKVIESTSGFLHLPIRPVMFA